MKIFYAIQATGNGHISRAMELLPHLKKYGEVDIFLSGSNCNLQMNGEVKYRSKGLSLFYTGNGGLDYLKMIKYFSPFKIYKELKALPLEKYDLVLNDFESLTSLACAQKKINSVGFGHQASFTSSNTPRPVKKSPIGEWVLQHYAKATTNVGLHFEPYAPFILPPVIKQDIWNAAPSNKGYITVYLMSFSLKTISAQLEKIIDFTFEVFSKEVTAPYIQKNIHYKPVGKDAFDKSLINCLGIITGAGFETPAEALYLQKKLMVLPIKGQYEQQCNAAALKHFSVSVLSDLSNDFDVQFYEWMSSNDQKNLIYKNDTASIVEAMMQIATA